MTNGKISFELEGAKHSLYFGMVATEMIAVKSAEWVKKHGVKNQMDIVKSSAYIIYAGLCNQSDLTDNERPDFEFAYELTEAILNSGDELQNKIFTTWSEAKATIEMMSRLNVGDKKKAEK